MSFSKTQLLLLAPILIGLVTGAPIGPPVSDIQKAALASQGDLFTTHDISGKVADIVNKGEGAAQNPAGSLGVHPKGKRSTKKTTAAATNYMGGSKGDSIASAMDKVATGGKVASWISDHEQSQQGQQKRSAGGEDSDYDDDSLHMEDKRGKGSSFAGALGGSKGNAVKNGVGILSDGASLISSAESIAHSKRNARRGVKAASASKGGFINAAGGTTGNAVKNGVGILSDGASFISSADNIAHGNGNARRAVKAASASKGGFINAAGGTTGNAVKNGVGILSDGASFVSSAESIAHSSANANANGAHARRDVDENVITDAPEMQGLHVEEKRQWASIAKALTKGGLEFDSDYSDAKSTYGTQANAAPGTVVMEEGET